MIFLSKWSACLLTGLALLCAPALTQAQTLDQRLMEQLQGEFADYFAAVQAGDADTADSTADEIARISDHAELLALIEGGQLDPAQLDAAFANPVTQGSAGRLLNLIIDARAAAVEELYEDFGHYVLVARLDLAAASLQRLMNDADDATLLRVVETSRHDDQPLIQLQRFGQDGAELAAQALARLEAARRAQATDPTRIRANIRSLSGNQLQRRNATERLRAAGPYSAPLLLETLVDQERVREHPYISQAIVEIGQPLVAPLSAALPHLDPVTAGQVGQALGQIGDPAALPAIQLVLGHDALGSQTQRILSTARDTLAAAAGSNANASAAQMFTDLSARMDRVAVRGEDLPGIDPARNAGIVWTWNEQTNSLVDIAVPTEVFANVLAYRAAEQALAMQGNLDEALTLSLVSNFRRENSLPDGAEDRSYPASNKEAMFYAVLAGPQRLLDVLDVALADADTALALDALAALDATAGTHRLTSQGPNQPLLRALNYPDRRVRFLAAEAMAEALPTTSFEGLDRVMPALSEAVRQSADPMVLVIGSAATTRNEVLAQVEAAGFKAVGATSLSDAGPQLATLPGVDLLVVTGTASEVNQAVSASSRDYRMASAPVVGVVPPAELILIARAAEENPRLTAVDTNQSASEAFAQTLTAAHSAQSSSPIGEEESLAMAMRSAELLHQIGVADTVLSADEAVPALIAGLEDDREALAIAIARSLSVAPGQDAQRALASASLDATGQKQLAFLAALADSARRFGNQLTAPQVNQLADLVQSDDATISLAAATAFGALSLSTGDVTEVVTP